MLKPIIIVAALFYILITIFAITAALLLWGEAVDDDDRDYAAHFLRNSLVWPLIALKGIREMIESINTTKTKM